jgi:serine/threonine-protein kinase
MSAGATLSPSGDISSPSAVVPAAESMPALAKYDVILKLASGGMADIYVAQRSGEDDICVIKQLHEHLAKDQIVGNRFYREARVASALNHPNIARLTDAGREGDLFYLAMEFIAGQDVETMMFKLMEQRKMLPPQLSISVTLKVLEALHYAHEFHEPETNKHLEIVHRDLSPRNVMLTYSGEVKVIDFGLARTNLGDFRTAPGMVLGTLRYMSPEQAVAEPVDRRSDIYTWAVVLYEMLSGRPLVMGANAHEVLHAVVTQEADPLSTKNPDLPRGLDRVLERGMAKDRRERFETAKEFHDALEQAAEGMLATEAQIGRFVTDLFPDEYHKTMTMVDCARRGENPSYEATRYEQLHDVTRAATIMRNLGNAQVVPAALPPPTPEPPPEPSRTATDYGVPFPHARPSSYPPGSMQRTQSQVSAVLQQRWAVPTWAVMSAVASFCVLVVLGMVSISRKAAERPPVAQTAREAPTAAPIARAESTPKPAPAAIEAPEPQRIDPLPQRRVAPAHKPEPTRKEPEHPPSKPALVTSAPHDPYARIRVLLDKAYDDYEKDNGLEPKALHQAKGMIELEAESRPNRGLIEMCVANAYMTRDLRVTIKRLHNCVGMLKEQ